MCKLCQEALAQLTHLMKHMLCIHNTEKPYYCEICKGYYKVETDFEEQISEIHLGDTPIVEHALMVMALKNTSSLEPLHNNSKDDYNDPWRWPLELKEETCEDETIHNMNMGKYNRFPTKIKSLHKSARVCASLHT